MSKRKIPMFTLAEERTTKDGFKIQIYLGVGYRMVLRQYSETMVDIHVQPDEDTSRFIPYIYVQGDDEGRPTSVRVETVSYGSLPIKDYIELQRAMSLAVIHAEEIEERFIKAIREEMNENG